MSDMAGLTTSAERHYASPPRRKVRRTLLASLLCAIAASVIVALIAALVAFVASTVTAIAGEPPSRLGQQDGVMAGALLAVMLAGFNWYLFFIVIPVTWLALLGSLGRLPKRGIARHMPYYRWGMIWGALLVGGTTGFFGLMMGPAAGAGAISTGSLIGAAGGFICAALFLAIVRPKQQLGEIETDVF